MKTLEQSAPIPNAERPVVDIAIERLKARDLIGTERYKTRLQPFNGRDYARDEDEEADDWYIYQVGRREERRQIDARLRAILEQIERDTCTVGSDWGIPHVAKLAREALTLLPARTPASPDSRSTNNENPGAD